MHLSLFKLSLSFLFPFSLPGHIWLAALGKGAPSGLVLGCTLPSVLTFLTSSSIAYEIPCDRSLHSQECHHHRHHHGIYHPVIPQPLGFDDRVGVWEATYTRTKRCCHGGSRPMSPTNRHHLMGNPSVHRKLVSQLCQDWAVWIPLRL
ncbi:hypothetical protein BDV39DRAFT_57468 [Aspergillus sergii]|uniref:Uncharacterized protein n=1 Tax=Aspergillus sergii TaxID=1034303 RepID=A0A5N6X7G3_9EURO|nr:hypothetical protein BDV39DRAFT_57468 [Aspergillus sergii]